MSQNIVIIWDTRPENSDSKLEEKGFFDKGKECTTRIIERKIMSLEKVSIGIILLGTNGNSDFNILYDLEKPTWNMIRNLPNLPSESKGNLLAGLNVANSLLAKKPKVMMIEHRIVLISKSVEANNIDMSKLEETLNEFKNNNIRIDIIGCETILAKEIAKATNGLFATFVVAMKELIFYQKKHVKQRFWEVYLQLGSNKIPIRICIRNMDKKLLDWKNNKDSPSNKNRKENSKKPMLYFNSKNENINSKELIKGYIYGNKVIPTSESDKSSIFESGPESLVIYGFTPSSNITWQNLNDNSLFYVLGQEGDRNAQITIKYIAHCLHELNLVAIARGRTPFSTKKDDNSSRMYALMPFFDTNEFTCLTMTSVCYKEEIKYMAFPQISKKINCTTEQVEAFKDLITAMDLTDICSDEECAYNEAFIIGQTPSPSAQHGTECVVHRAKNPGVPLPQPNSDVLSLFEVPQALQNQAKSSLERLQSLFVLNIVKEEQNTVDKSSKTMDVATCSNRQEDTEKKLHSVGTIDPIGDYKLSLKLDTPLNILAREMTDVIESLIHSNFNEHFTKAMEALRFFRVECANGDPSYYNNWLNNFKLELADCGRNDVIELINKNEMDLILKNDNVLSDFKDYPKRDIEMKAEFIQLKVSSKLEDMFN